MDYTVTVHFNSPEDCAWFAKQCQAAREKVLKGTQLEGGSRAILVAALGRSALVESSMSEARIISQIRGG